jgi:hypothetical protein
VVKKREAFPSKWLIPADLDGGSVVVTINKAVLEPMKDFNAQTHERSSFTSLRSTNHSP